MPAQVFTPGHKDRVSIQKVHTTKEDRAKDRETFKERKAEQEKIKAERFERIEKERKNRHNKTPGTGRGINLEVKGE